MQVILLEEVDHLGPTGSLVHVANGYARNFLLPRKKAMLALARNKRQMAHAQRQLQARATKERAEAEAAAQKVAKVVITVARRVGEQGKLFGAVTSQDIVSALAEQGVQVDKRKVGLSEVIKEVGEFTVPIRLSANVQADIKLCVVAEAV